jgi:hypothetical protein
MMAQAIHSRIINRVAREVLTPLGLHQKGRSRSWFDDHGWWLILVEFQPSGFDKGAYLNVGINWLWYEKNYFSFDYGYRVEPFIQYESEIQFENEAQKIVLRAAQEVEHYRQVFRSFNDSKKVLTRNTNQNVWTLYHAAIASGICGDTTKALNLFQSIIRLPVNLAWERELNNHASQLALLVNDKVAFRNQISAIIMNTRNILGLPEWDIASLFD